MDLRENRYILAIAKYGSITKAADMLHVTQPALSKFLMNLEEELGESLFVRHPKGLTPTLIGEHYLKYAREISVSHENWKREYQDLRQETRGRLRIAIPPARSSVFIAKVLKPFYERFPDVQVVLHEAANQAEKFATENGEVDFVIYNCNDPLPGLTYEVLGQEEIVLLAADQSMLQHVQTRLGAAHPNLPLEAVREEPFILQYEDQTTGSISRNLIRQAGFRPRVLLETRSSEVAMQMAAAGLGLSFVPESYLSLLHFDIPPLRFSVGDPCTKVNLCAAYARGRYLPSYARFFIGTASKVFSELCVSQNTVLPGAKWSE